MDKDRKSLLHLIVISLVIAGVLNSLLGAFLESGGNKSDTRENSSLIQGVKHSDQAVPFTVKGPANVSSQQFAWAKSTPGAVSAADYQDAQWIENVQKHSELLGKDIEEVNKTKSNLDSDTLEAYGQYLIEDTKTAIEENKQYIVSPKCQDAQKEWELALNDYSSAGELMSQFAGEAKNNDTDSDDIKQVLSLIDSGSGHFRKVQEFLITNA